jgi:hypothetical protein
VLAREGSLCLIPWGPTICWAASQCPILLATLTVGRPKLKDWAEVYRADVVGPITVTEGISDRQKKPSVTLSAKSKTSKRNLLRSAPSKETKPF